MINQKNIDKIYDVKSVLDQETISIPQRLYSRTFSQTFFNMLLIEGFNV